MKYESSRFIKTGGMKWDPVNDKLKRKIMGLNDEIMMVLVHFQKGGIGERHAHFHSQTTYVESGKFEVYIDGEQQVLEAGDGFYIPPNIEHGAVCLEEGKLIDVFSPTREDFLEGETGYSK